MTKEEAVTAYAAFVSAASQTQRIHAINLEKNEPDWLALGPHLVHGARAHTLMAHLCAEQVARQLLER